MSSKNGKITHDLLEKKPSNWQQKNDIPTMIPLGIGVLPSSLQISQDEKKRYQNE